MRNLWLSRWEAEELVDLLEWAGDHRAGCAHWALPMADELREEWGMCSQDREHSIDHEPDQGMSYIPDEGAQKKAP